MENNKEMATTTDKEILIKELVKDLGSVRMNPTAKHCYTTKLCSWVYPTPEDALEEHFNILITGRKHTGEEMQALWRKAGYLQDVS